MWFPRARTIELRDEAVPGVGPRDVRVRAVASALSHGTEMLVYRGQVPAELALDLPTLAGSFDLPIKYGYASVGRVVEIGGDVNELAVGDLVFTHHPHQTEYVVSASLPIRLDPGTDPEAAVFLANIETAVNVVLDAAPRIGERIVVLGQGVVGLLVTQLLRRAGVSCVIAVEPIARRRALARACGADVAVAPDDAADAVRDATRGAGADLAIEASGKGGALALAIDLVAFQGTIVVCSWYGAAPVALPLGGAFHRRRLRLVSSQVSHLDPALAPRWDPARRLALARSLVADLVTVALISHRIPVSRAPEAYALVDQHPEETVQVVLTYP